MTAASRTTTKMPANCRPKTAQSKQFVTSRDEKRSAPDTARPEKCAISTRSGALRPCWERKSDDQSTCLERCRGSRAGHGNLGRCAARPRSEEHTSELQSLRHLVCRLLLEKK